jgi:hypothetical protein
MFSSAESPGAPAAAAQRTVHRWKAWLTMIMPNSNSDSAGISPAARWAEETMGPRLGGGAILTSPALSATRRNRMPRHLVKIKCIKQQGNVDDLLTRTGLPPTLSSNVDQAGDRRIGSHVRCTMSECRAGACHRIRSAVQSYPRAQAQPAESDRAFQRRELQEISHDRSSPACRRPCRCDATLAARRASRERQAAN